MSEETKKTSEEQEAEKEIPVTDGDQEEKKPDTGGRRSAGGRKQYSLLGKEIGRLQGWQA